MGEGGGGGSPSPHLSRAAGFMRFTGLEPSVLCPISMTCAVTPALKDNPARVSAWKESMFTMRNASALRCKEISHGDRKKFRMMKLFSSCLFSKQKIFVLYKT
ncbi:MAG: hypothetical protein EST26_01420 [Hydrogenophaga sp.]|nr:hypothetical protein [Hydrogenophaga sp.]